MYDIIIVGGGVAGCHLASLIGKKHDVLILEKNDKPVQKDSGIVSKRFFDIFPNDAKRLVKCEINRMECVSPSGITFDVKSEDPFAYILEREMFSKFLIKTAAKRSEIVYEGAEAVNISPTHTSVKTAGGVYKAKMVIGCDGALSIVRKAMNIENPKMAVGLMIKTQQKMEGDINVFFNKYFSPDFFSWIIPQNYEYGLMTCIRPKEYLDYFVKNMYLPRGKMHAYMIPYSFVKSYSTRSLLVGDACGQNKPLTGGGIIFSMLAAQHAGTIINDALEYERYDNSFLRYYEQYWKKELAAEIKKQLFFRKIYRNLSNKEVDKLFTEFGPYISRLTEFDYDKLSNIWTHIPKVKIIRHFLPKILRAL
ncbi:NAD(P)/FAD-dependent oxidoreductase [archaeon]|nr:NAD(P)/FAD-dependent oxidoreductase [archaeon]